MNKLNHNLNGNGNGKEKWYIKLAKQTPFIGSYIRKLEEENVRLRVGAVDHIIKKPIYGLTLEDTLNEIVKEVYLSLECDAVRLFQIQNIDSKQRVAKGLGIKRDGGRNNASFFEITDYPNDLDTKTGRVLPYVVRSKEMLYLKVGKIGSDLYTIDVDREKGKVKKNKINVDLKDMAKITENSEKNGVFEKLETPLLDNGKVNYVIVTDNAESGKPIDDIRILRMWNERDSIMLHIKNAELAIKDGLTGLYNRRYFNEFYHREFVKTTKHWPRYLSLLEIDIDYFKDKNTKYGHSGGDIILKGTANEIRNSSHENDFVARWGGEEFVVIISEMRAEQAYDIAERMRKKIMNKYYNINGEEVNATVSIGIADSKSGIDLTKEIAKAAYKKDESLRSYEEKETIAFTENRNHYIIGKKNKPLSAKTENDFFSKHGILEKAVFDAMDMSLLYAKETGRNRSHVCNIDEYRKGIYPVRR